MTRCSFLIAACLMLFVGITLLAPSPSMASNDRPLAVTDKNGERIKCSELPEAKGGVVIGYMVPCLIHSIETGTVSFSKAMIDWLRPLLFAFITFVVVMFGVKIVQAEGEVHKEGLLLLLKIAMVIAMLDMIPEFIVPSLYAVMAETQEVVMSGINQENFNCELDKFGDANTPVIWKQMDCIMGKLYGYTTGEDGAPNMLLAASIFGMLGGFFFSGTFGVTVFFAMIGVLWTMFMLVIKTIFSFVNAYLYASLLLILSPLFMPLVFLKATNNYFEQWWKGILASVLMPLVISSYVMIAMLIYDVMLFNDNSLVRELFKADVMTKAQGLPRQACGRDIVRIPEARAERTGQSEQDIMDHPFLKNLINPFISGSNDLCAGIRTTQIDLDNLKDDLKIKHAREGFEKLFKDCIKLFLLAWLVNAGFSNIMQIVRRIIGAPAVVQTMEPNSPMEIKMQRAMSFGRQYLDRELRYSQEEGRTREQLRGPEFIQRLPGALWTGTRGFMAGLSDDPEGFMRMTESQRQQQPGGTTQSGASTTSGDEGGPSSPAASSGSAAPGTTQRGDLRAALRGTDRQQRSQALTDLLGSQRNADMYEDIESRIERGEISENELAGEELEIWNRVKSAMGGT